ncbi:MAG: branched-chain amino acid ABC transporter permease [Alphaproteobacteria bacterium]|nr:branched-chain amino acid ABC transporter permease [Alphaproteobacteria bacterium]
MTGRRLQYAGLAVLVALPFVGVPEYYMHILVLILIWGFVYTAWAIMGRFGLVSLGHGAFLGIGAYTVALAWNLLGLTPWLGIPLGVGLAVLVAVVIGYPCFRFRVVGHYFALVTLALGEVVRLTIVALRDHTGGSLGLTPNRYGEGTSLYALQFADKEVFYVIALLLWLAGIWIWRRVDASMARFAMDALSEDEDAAASVGVHVTAQKLRITMLSAALTALGGGVYAQYLLYVNPGTVSGIGVSLQIVFAAIAGGMFTALGPTVGAMITIVLAETLRIAIGTEVIGLDTTIYGVMLILFIIFLPKGVLGGLIELYERRTAGGAGAMAGKREVGGGA